KSPVTVADFGSQAVICRALGIAFPDDPVIAEEDAAELGRSGNPAVFDEVVCQVRALGLDADCNPSPAEVCSWIDRGGSSQYCDRFWTIDPIDGTKGFLRNEQYAVALALIVEGQVVVAALLCPNLPIELGFGRRESGRDLRGRARAWGDCRAAGTGGGIRTGILASASQQANRSRVAPILRVGRVRPQRTWRRRCDRGAAGDRRATRQDG